MIKMDTSLRQCLCGFLVFSVVLFVNSVSSCGYPGAPAHSSLTFSSTELTPGVIASYACEPGFELLGPARRVCSEEAKWTPEGIPFCVLNVAAGKAPMQSSVAGSGVPQKAVDGSAASFFNPTTCTLTQPERAPWWYVNLLEPYMVQLVRLDFGRPCCGDGQVANIVVRVGNNRPDLGVNPVCNKFVGVIEEGKPLFLPCNPPIAGAFVSVQLEGPPGNSLSICEAFVYTDQALPIERCPQFRDQPPGSTATYNGKCYIFYSQQTLRFEEARQFCVSRGGSLVDDSNPALQGFLSWEMWRRHRSDPTAQYWLGATRDSKDTSNWKWLNGKDVTVSFWDRPGGRGNCARFDGSKGWLWSDTNCNDAHNFICQHGPRGCGRPEQPPNSTLLATSLEVGARIDHRCDLGHVLVGPITRQCLPNGFYSEFPPVCRYLECGSPALIPNGRYTLINGTRSYLSQVRYSCDEGHAMVGRNDLACDLDQKWNGPPPRCEALHCPEPPPLMNGYYDIVAQSENAYTVSYECNPNFALQGPNQLTCAEGVYDQPPPVCREIIVKIPVSAGSTTSSKGPTPRPVSVSVTIPTTPVTTPAPPLTQEAEEDPHYEEDSYYPVPGGENEHNNLDQEKSNPSDEGILEYSSTSAPTLAPVPKSSTKAPGVAGVINGNKIDLDVDQGLNSEHGAESIKVNNIVHPGKTAGADIPRTVQTKSTSSTKLNLGGIIALGVFGGFILLAAIITSIVLLIRRNKGKRKHERHRGSPDSHTITSVDSGSDAGLGRLYRRAWDSLAATGPPTGSTMATSSKSGKVMKDTLDFRSRLSSVEGMRDEGEIIVHDALPRKHHHHHHGMHHHHNGHNHDAASVGDWGRSVRSHRSRY